MKTLELHNLGFIFYKMDKNRKYSVYHEPINNNLIVFNPYDNCTIDDVCNATVSEGAYEYLINVLNNEQNVVINWAEVEGTTSDYVIYYGFDVTELKNKTHKEIMSMLPMSNLSYKFTEFRNDKQSIIDTRSFVDESREVQLGEWETEIEAAQAYNIGAIIFNGEDAELNDVPPPSRETFNKVISLLNEQGWRATNQEMQEIIYLMRTILKMN